MKYNYYLWIPEFQPDGTPPGHSLDTVLADPPDSGPDRVKVSFFFEDALDDDPSNVRVHLLDDDFIVARIYENGAVCKETVYSESLYDIDTLNQRWRAIFTAMDDHADLRRDHASRLMVAINKAGEQALANSIADQASEIAARMVYEKQGRKTLIDPAARHPHTPNTPDVVMYRLNADGTANILVLDNKCHASVTTASNYGFGQGWSNWDERIRREIRTINDSSLRTRLTSALNNGRLEKAFTNADGEVFTTAMDGTVIHHIDSEITDSMWKAAVKEAKTFHQEFYSTSKWSFLKKVKASRDLRLAGYVGTGLEVAGFIYIWVKGGGNDAAFTAAADTWARNAVFADEVEALAAWGKVGVYRFLGGVEKRWLNMLYHGLLQELEKEE